MINEPQEFKECTAILGAEYDDSLRGALRRVLVQLGARQLSRKFGIAGSQELETLVFDVAGKHLIVEAETYTGISISGEELLVNQIIQLIKNENPASGTGGPG